MRTKSSLTLEDANTVMTAAKAAARAKGWGVTIAVVDEAGFPLHIERLDGALLKSVDIGIGKAATAAQMRRSTKDLEEIANTSAGLLTVPNLFLMQGGLPIFVKGECVGAVGVSGVQPHEDEEVARAGIAALTPA